MPDDWVGGARGPAALPSRTAAFGGAGDRPAPRDTRIGGFAQVSQGGRLSDSTGEQGIISYHRGIMVEDAGAPRLYYDNELYHNHLPWSRPYYANVQGQLNYAPPTQQPSWSSNSDVVPPLAPTVPIPFTKKKIGNFMVRPPYGNTSSGMLFTEAWNKGQPLTGWVNKLRSQSGFVQGRRWIAQAKTHQPTLVNLAKYAMAGSYGQTTTSLDTAPTNTPGGGANPYGSY